MKQIPRTLEELQMRYDAGIAGLVIVQISKFDAMLEDCIKTKLRIPSRALESRLFESYGPLSTFAAKIDLTYALEIIPTEIYEELGKIRRIRNEFSHSREVIGFDDKKIKSIFDSMVKRGDGGLPAMMFVDCMEYIVNFLDDYLARHPQLGFTDLLPARPQST